MRGLMIGVALLALSACGKSGDDEADGFIPPTVQARGDFESRLDARFRRLDHDSSGMISANELPKRRPERVAAYDSNKNGTITREEFVNGALVLFDRADANHDGSVTTEERKAIGWVGRN